MIHRFIGTGARLVQQMASQPVTWSSVIKAARGVLTTAQHTLTVFGLSAVAMLALLYQRPELARRASDFLSPQQSAPAPAATAVAANAATRLAPVHPGGAVEIANADAKASAHPTRQQKYVTDWLSRRYRVAGDAANMLVTTAYSTARDIKLDPLLILAVMAIESGLNPFAESPMGAQGLMQVMSKVHSDKFQEVGGSQAALNPVANIHVGARILKDYVTRTGSVEAGLKSYVGAGAIADDSGYGSKVLTEYNRLKQVASGKSVPIYFPPPTAQSVILTQKAANSAAKPDSPAPETAHGDSEVGETVAGL